MLLAGKEACSKCAGAFEGTGSRAHSHRTAEEVGREGSPAQPCCTRQALQAKGAEQEEEKGGSRAQNVDQLNHCSLVLLQGKQQHL